jgi:hypothetical protein
MPEVILAGCHSTQDPVENKTGKAAMLRVGTTGNELLWLQHRGNHPRGMSAGDQSSK